MANNRPGLKIISSSKKNKSMSSNKVHYLKTATPKNCSNRAREKNFPHNVNAKKPFLTFAGATQFQTLSMILITSVVWFFMGYFAISSFYKYF